MFFLALSSGGGGGGGGGGEQWKSGPSVCDLVLAKLLKCV